MSYIKTNWQNKPSQSTPLNATNLNHIEDGIYDVSTSLGDLSNLTTSEKNNIVGSINEINSKIIIESGTWTPTFLCPKGTNPTYTLSDTNAYYYRIGRLVYINFSTHVNITNKGSGTAYIGGLPFAGDSNIDTQSIAVSVRGPYTYSTVFFINPGQTTMIVGMTTGEIQTWAAGSFNFGACGCYLIS